MICFVIPSPPSLQRISPHTTLKGRGLFRRERAAKVSLAGDTGDGLATFRHEDARDVDPFGEKLGVLTFDASIGFQDSASIH